MKCINCKFQIEIIEGCAYPFKSITTADNSINKKGKTIGCTHGLKKYENVHSNPDVYLYLT
jgi:hypothetical protein